MKRLTLLTTIFLLTFTYCYSVLGEEVSQETSMFEQDSEENELNEMESDEIMTTLNCYVTFIDEERNTKKVIEVPAGTTVSPLTVSKNAIKYKKNKTQVFSYWGIKVKNGYKQFDFNSSIDEDITLYAVYIVFEEPDERNFAVKSVWFDACNGEKIETDIIENHKISCPKEPTKSGYRFLGWYTEPTGGEKWNFKKDKAYNDITLYAHWEKITDSYYVSPKTGFNISGCLYLFIVSFVGVIISGVRLRKVNSN